MATTLSTSIAEEFVICTKCHHPIGAQEESSISAPGYSSTPLPHTPGYSSTPLPHAPGSRLSSSTPSYVDVDSKASRRLLRVNECDNSTATEQSSFEVLRDADQSCIVDEDLSFDQDMVFADPQLSLLKDFNLTLGQCSFLELPPSRLAQVADLEMSEEFLPGYLSELPHITSTALCRSCSLYDGLAPAFRDVTGGGDGRPGSRMSMYFPNKTGVDRDCTRRDSFCYSDSEDSGACDVDDVIPSSHECSKYDDDGEHVATPCEHFSVMDNVQSILQSSVTACRSHDHNDTSFEIIDMPIKNTSHHLLDDLTTQVDARHRDIDQIHSDLDQRFSAARSHLKSAREYYLELVEQWFWRNMIVLEREQEQAKRDQEQQAETAREAIAEIKQCVAHIEQTQQQGNIIRYGAELTKKLQELDGHVNDLKMSVGALTEVTFTVGRCERLTADHLGGVIVQRRPNTEQVPRVLLPGKCLASFDSRQGRVCEYMATGLSLTTGGDLIVTDTGLDTVNVFGVDGELRLNVNVQPEDYPTTAVQFKDTIAVACSGEVKLYDMMEGVYHPTQLTQSLVRPQGVTTDSLGHLVVSAQQVDIPALGVYNHQSHLVNEIVVGDARCSTANEDVIGCELDEITNPVLFTKPWYVAVDQSDRFVISDRDSHTVRVISRSGDLIEEIGSLGHKPGQFFHPAGLCVDPHGRIIIADSQNHRVQVLTPGQGHAVSVVTQEHDGIECPMDVALDSQGRLYVLQGDGQVRTYQYC